MRAFIRSVIAFIPIIVFALLVLVAKYDILIVGMICTFLALFIAMGLLKKSFAEVFNIGAENTKHSVATFFIIMFAYAVAEIFLASGVGAAIIGCALNFGITARSIAIVAFLVTGVLSVSTGTSWGTFAACAPIFLWLNYMVGGNIILTLGTIVGGCAFGDNIGLISDTTVLSSGLQGVKITDRVRHQGVWSLLCFLITAIIVMIISSGYSNQVSDPMEVLNSITPEIWEKLEAERPSAVLLLEQVQSGVPIYMVIPVIVIVVTTVMGVSTMACLGSGLVSTLILGLIAGTVPDLNTFMMTYVFEGFASAGSWAIILIMWITAFAGIMNAMNAFDPIAKLFVRISKKVRHLMTCNAILCLLVNAILGDENSEIATTGPILKEIVEKNVEGDENAMYKLRLRNATFADAMGVYGAQFVPWHACVVFYLSIAASVYPLQTFTPANIIEMNYMSMIVVVSMLVLTFTGLDRYIPLFKIPSEPEVKLKK